MALALLVSCWLAQAPVARPIPVPSAAETARLYFLAGDLAKAQEWAQRGLKRERKKCAALNQALAEYSFLAHHLDELSLDQARQFLAWDKKISPQARGKLTEQVLERYVRKPLSLAQMRAAGDTQGALALVSQVLAVDPQNAEAKELQARLKQ